MKMWYNYQEYLHTQTQNKNTHVHTHLHAPHTLALSFTQHMCMRMFLANLFACIISTTENAAPWVRGACHHHECCVDILHLVRHMVTPLNFYNRSRRSSQTESTLNVSQSTDELRGKNMHECTSGLCGRDHLCKEISRTWQG